MPQGEICNAEMERVAGLLVTDLAEKGLTLDYTPESLRALDMLLANYGHDKGNGDNNMGLVELVGAYFGEVLRGTLGGNWYENVPPDNATGLLLDVTYDVWVWCHAIVYKQLEQGNKSLFKIYPDIADKLQDLRNGLGFRGW